MEIETLIGQLMLRITKDTQGNSEEYKQFLEELTKIANLYQQGKDNSKLIKGLIPLRKSLEKFAGIDKNQQEHEEKQEQQFSPETLKQNEDVEDKGLKQPVNKETIFKEFDWMAYVYTDKERLKGRFSNDGFNYSDKEKINEELSGLSNCRMNNLHKAIIRDEDRYLVMITTEELTDIRLTDDTRGSTKGQMIAFVINQEDLPYLNISEDTKLMLEDNSSLVRCIEDDNINNRKVLVPFSSKKIEVDSIETEFADFIFEVLKYDRGQNRFAIVSNNEQISMKELIKLSNIFSGTNYDYSIADNNMRSCKRDERKFCDYDRREYVRNIQNGPSEVFYDSDLMLDIKNGFCSKENIDKVEGYIRKLEIFNFRETLYDVLLKDRFKKREMNKEPLTEEEMKQIQKDERYLKNREVRKQELKKCIDKLSEFRERLNKRQLPSSQGEDDYEIGQ